MIRVLMVANHFPPIGGGGVQRASKFARYLSLFEIAPTVLTGPEGAAGHWTPPDPTMLADVEGIDVVRVPGQSVPDVRGRFRKRIERTLGRPSKFIRWWLDSVEDTGLAAGEGVDVILAELVPYDTAFAVEKLARRLGVPWIADLQDPWALDEMWIYPSAVHRVIDRRRMRRTLNTAAAVIMNTPEAKSRLVKAFPEFQDRRVASIPNGFDLEDFKPSQPRSHDDVFRIVHTGYLHTELGLRHRGKGRWRRILGGMPVPGVDFLSRSHVYLLRAVAKAIEQDPTLHGAIEVHLAGIVNNVDKAAAADFPFVRFHGYLPHQETIALLRDADLLFLPMQDLPPGLRAGLVPGKTYEYMASGTPILAAVPPGDARDILLALGNATVCEPTAVDCLADGIRERVQAWRAGAPRVDPSPAVLAAFERRKLTADLASLLEDVVQRPSRLAPAQDTATDGSPTHESR